MEKFYKLGEKAATFTDVSTGLSIDPGQVIKVSIKQAASSRFKRAVAGGHIVIASKEDYSNFLNSKEESEKVSEQSDKDALLKRVAELEKENEEKAERIKELEGDEEDEIDFDSMEKEDLISYAQENSESLGYSDEDIENLSSMKRGKIIKELKEKTKQSKK